MRASGVIFGLRQYVVCTAMQYIWLLPDTSSRYLYTAVQVRNSHCESFSSRQQSRYMKPTKSSLWRSEKIELKTGVNILYWRAFLPPRSSAGMRQPVLIQSIDISGRYFTALCYIKGKGYTHLIWRLFVVNHHRRSAQVWHVFSRDFTVLPVHPHVYPQSE